MKRLVFMMSLVCLLLTGMARGDTFSYKTSDGRLSLQVDEEFQTTFNPHAILSLMTADRMLVIVTSRPQEYEATRIFDGAPFSFPDGAECVGRVLLSVDGEDAPTFLVEGLFPPDEVATHSTVYTIVNHKSQEYTIMIHYPIDMEDGGLEWAVELLQRFRWLPKSSSSL